MLIRKQTLDDGIVLIRMIGRLELGARSDLIELSTMTNGQKLIIDLSFLSHITLEGVQILASIAIESGVAKTNVFFIEPHADQVREKLEVVGILQHLVTFTGVNIALETLRQS